MKKNKKLYLILTILASLYPTIVFADNEDVPLAFAIFWVLFASLHWYGFAFYPIGQVLSKDEGKAKAIAMKLSIARWVILFLIIPYHRMYFIVDFILLFVCAFGGVFLGIFKGITRTGTRSSLISTTINTKTCPKCNMVLLPTDKFCGSCGTQIDPSAPMVVQGGKTPFGFNQKYAYNVDVTLRNIIVEEVQKAGLNSELTLPEIKRRKMIFTILFAIITFMMVSLVFFHLPLGYYLIELVALFIYLIGTSKGDIYKVLIKEVKARPDEKISNIISSKVAQMEAATPKLTYLLIISVAAFIPLVIFSSPKVFYEEYNDGYRVRFYAFGLNNMNTVEIPERHNGKAVVALRGNAFSNMPLLTKVKLPDTITEINGQAFLNDINLQSVRLPENLKYLGGGSFKNCTSLESIILPDSLTELQGEMFVNCTNLKEVYIPRTMTIIHGETFINCTSLRSIELPAGLTEIRGDTFNGCSSLDNVIIPEGVTRIGGHAFEDCSSLTNVTIPRTVTEIGSSAFRRCYNLSTVTVPRNAYIADNSFKESPTYINYAD